MNIVLLKINQYTEYVNQRGFVSLIIIPILIVILVGGVVGYGYYNTKSKQPVATPVAINLQTANPTVVGNNPLPTPYTYQPQNIATPTPTTQSSTSGFCKNYGTYEIVKSSLFKEYTTSSGESFRQIAKLTLNDETKAPSFVLINPTLMGYGIDDPLPIQTKVLIPDDKYLDKEGSITNYIKSKGNIAFNKDKPMFGVNAPNSGTGPFIISDNIKTDLTGIAEGDCVEVVYGSHGFDPQKVVFEVKRQ